MRVRRREFLRLATGGAACAAPLRAAAQTFPARPVKLMLGFPAGSPPDVVARLIAPGISERLGQQVIVENKPGASANIASAQAARAEPDGHTILMIVATNTINQTLYPNLEFDIVRDFAPVASVMRIPNVLVVTPALPVSSLPELIAYAKANPGKLNFASSGSGSSPHVTMEMFKAMAGVEMTHVPYSSNYFPDLLSGQTQVLSAAIPGAAGFVRAGQLRPLAVSTARRSEFFPELPAIGEVVPGYEASGWYGIVAPKNTPAAIVETLHRAIGAALADPGMKARFPDFGGSDFISTPAEFGAFIVDEVVKWGKVVKSAHITAQ